MTYEGRDPMGGTINEPEFEQQPFVPLVTDDQIIGMARVLHGSGDVTIDHEGGVLHRYDNGASVAAEIFVPRAHIEQFGAYVPHADDEDTYEPGPHLNALLTGARSEFTEDIRRGCNMAMLDNANYKAPLWERIAKSTITILMVAAIAAYWGHIGGEARGYKAGVSDAFKATIQMLKSAADEPEKAQ